MVHAMRAVIFDVGHVLVDWDLRHIYRRQGLASDEVERIVSTIVTPEWHFQSDAGRPLAEMVAERQAEFPADAQHVATYAERFTDSIPGGIAGMEALLADLDGAGVPLFAITNFGAEHWARFRPMQPMLARFRDVVVSGEERLTKPDPAIYTLALARFGLTPAEALFIDDRPDNIAAAEALGIAGHVFTDEPGCRAWLARQGLPI